MCTPILFPRLDHMRVKERYARPLVSYLIEKCSSLPVREGLGHIVNRTSQL